MRTPPRPRLLVTAEAADRLRGSGVGWTLVAAMSVPACYWFERLLWRRFEPKPRAGVFDLAHCATLLSAAAPGFSMPFP